MAGVDGYRVAGHDRVGGKVYFGYVVDRHQCIRGRT